MMRIKARHCYLVPQKQPVYRRDYRNQNMNTILLRMISADENR